MHNYLTVMFVGHFIGDYLFQTSKMAREKNKPGFKGWLWALFHGLVYTQWMAIVFTYFYPMFFVELSGYFVGFFIFTWLTHSTIDHYSLGKKWSKMMGSDTLPDFTLEENNTKKEVSVVEMYKASFTSVVYIVVDNTWHIVLQALYLHTFWDKF